MTTQGKAKRKNTGRATKAGENGVMVKMEAVRKAFDEIDAHLTPSYEALQSMAGIMNLMVYSLNQVWKEADNEVSMYISEFGIEHVGALSEKLKDTIKEGIKSTYDILYKLTKTGPHHGEFHEGVKGGL
jgi:hypothetical protein